MRYLLLTLVVLSVSFVKPNNRYIQNDPGEPVLAFDELVYDFGKVQEGELVRHDFHFTNKGKGPLIIRSAMTACGCDGSEFPEEPVAPGKSGVISYKLDTKSRMGRDERTITVLSNDPKGTLVLTITGEIIPHSEAPQSPGHPERDH